MYSFVDSLISNRFLLEFIHQKKDAARQISEHSTSAAPFSSKKGLLPMATGTSVQPFTLLANQTQFYVVFPQLIESEETRER